MASLTDSPAVLKTQLSSFPQPPASTTMDQALKARKLSSASVRRKKFQERQQQHELDRERYHEHKRRILFYDHMADQMSGDSEEDSDDGKDKMEVDDNGRRDRESSVETPSERSVPTPDDILSSKAAFRNQGNHVIPSNPPLKLEIPEEATIPMDLDDQRVHIPPSPVPVMQASLASFSDFRYDRYSCLIESPPSITSPESTNSVSDYEGEETFSPIETATPVCYSQPKSRPSLISIENVSSRIKRPTVSAQSPLSQSISNTANRASRRASGTSTHSGYPAAEATLYEVPDLPANAFQLIQNMSQESLALPTYHTPPKSAHRKSSVPRLSTRLSHARMSSIKSFIRTPTTITPTSATFSTSGPPSTESQTLYHNRAPSQPMSHSSRPSTSSNHTATGAGGFPLSKHSHSNTSSSLLNIIRPQTSMSTMSSNSTTAAGSIHHPMTALPSLPTPPADETTSSEAALKAVSRKKSFSTLRRRSESIGQAIKGLGKSSSSKDAPPMPKSNQLVDLSTFPTPPMTLPSPQSIYSKKSSGSYFSTAPRSSSTNVGLGLRSVEGLSHH